MRGPLRLFSFFFQYCQCLLRVCAIVVFLASCAVFGIAQGESPATKIYESSKDSVFLVYLDDTNGAPTALGSAFVVAPHLLITNAHVVDAGKPVLSVGPVRVPLTLVRIDRQHDLALMSVALDLTSKPLPLASGVASPGDQVFAIGSPEGLENTISQGIVSGLRKIGDQDLIQVTSPISHGSSGGPLLSIRGEVMGVAVGMLENGQNLNFAVPVRYVRALMEGKPTATVSSFADCSSQFAHLKDLATQRNQSQYSEEASSPYQQATQELREGTSALVDHCAQPEVLQGVACLGTTAYDLSDSGIAAARKLVGLNSSADTRGLLAYVLYDRSVDEAFRLAVSKDGSTDATQAGTAQREFIAQAGRVATDLRGSGNKSNAFLVADYVLGRVKADANDNLGAMALDEQVVEGGPSICGQDISLSALRALVAEASNAGKADQAEMWFRRYAQKYQPDASDWDAEGDRRTAAGDYPTAADAYEKAAVNKYYAYDDCYAATDRYFQKEADPDAVLADGRKCIEGSVTETRDFAEKYYENKLPNVYDVMADVLEARGVYQESFDYIKSALAAKPNDPFVLEDEASILEDLQRYPECVAAAQAAIRASDGKYSSMHFRLGTCYFAMENWGQAETSFKLAAQGDPKDAAAAFNAGLSLQRQGFGGDAQAWFRMALQRDPDPELRSKILSALQ